MQAHEGMNSPTHAALEAQGPLTPSKADQAPSNKTSASQSPEKTHESNWHAQEDPFADEDLFDDDDDFELVQSKKSKRGKGKGQKNKKK